MESPLALSLWADTGVCAPEILLPPSPSLINVSTDFSRFPLRPLSTVMLRFSSGKPISFRLCSFVSKLSADALRTLCPNTRDALFTLGGEESPKPLKPMLIPGEVGGLLGFGEAGNVAEELRSPKPKRLPGFGGNGGGRSSAELVLPVFCLVPGRDSPERALCSYFCRIQRSNAPSTSSISIGMFGLTLFGLYILLEATFPTRFMFCRALLSGRWRGSRATYIDLVVAPTIHAQRFDL